jgi:hypothetical protein
MQRAWDKRYPEGMCKEIRDDVLERMKGEMLNTSRPGLQMLKNFVRGGGVIQPFWGIDKKMYFQNAIQIGDSILDVANDTVDHTKEPVVFYPSVHEAPIKRIENFEEFADVAEKYWEYEAYPNIYLPRFAPLFPVLTIRPARKDLLNTDSLLLETGALDLMYKNFTTPEDGHGFGLSSEFLFKGPYSEKRLPPEMLDELLNDKRLARAAQRRPDIFKVSTDPEEARAEIARFHIPDGATSMPREYLDEMTELLKYSERLERIPLASIEKGPPRI